MTTGTEAKKYQCTNCKEFKGKAEFYRKAGQPERGYTDSHCKQCKRKAEIERRRIRRMNKKPPRVVIKKSQEEIMGISCCPKCEKDRLVPLFDKATDSQPLPPKIGLICTYCVIEFLIGD